MQGSRRTSLSTLAILVAALSCNAQPIRAQSRDAGFAVPNAPTRENVADDVFHETLDVRVGSGPNGFIRLHRVVRERGPFRPKPTHGAVMLLHGDFSSFSSSFALSATAAGASGLAIWLAEQHFDVWGVDRRWALTPQDGDVSDFAAMSLEQELDDLDKALSLAQSLRGPTRTPGFHLIGFSRGGFVAYAAAARDARKQVRTLVPLDIWAEIAPNDEAARRSTCDTVTAEREQLAQGMVDVDNSYFINVGDLATRAPDQPSLDSMGMTNREVFLQTAAQTYEFFAPSAYYHLAAGELRDGVVTSLRESPEAVIAQWFKHATPHQSLLESVDTDGMWCGDGLAPKGPALADITAPLLLVTAAGGYGEHAVYSTTRVSSRDVSVLRIQRQSSEAVARDFGHADLLFATDAPELVWKPLAAWLRRH